MAGLVHAVADMLKPFLVKLTDDSAFRAGFLQALAVALFIGWVSRQLLYSWSRVRQFFAPTKKPATTPGLSPFNSCVGAITGLITLVGVGILIFVLLWIARGG